MREPKEIQAEIDKLITQTVTAIEQGRTDLAHAYLGKLAVLLWLSRPNLSNEAVQQAIHQMITRRITDQDAEQ